MRKLVMFGLLAVVLMGSLFLEQHMTRAKVIPPETADALELLIGSDEPAPHRKAMPEPAPVSRAERESPAVANTRPAPRLEDGESLEEFCERVYGDPLYAESLATANGFAKAADVTSAAMLELPSKARLERCYRVQRGDSLSKIAEQLLGSVKHADRLAAWNHLENKNSVRENQVLRIPDVSR